MIKVHHLDNSRSQRVLWLLEELGRPYEIVRYQRDANTMLAPAALRDIHPLGKSPVLEDDGENEGGDGDEDGDEDGDNQADKAAGAKGSLILAESAAIIEYLVERYDPEHRLWPPPQPVTAPERLRYRYWLHYAEGSAMPPLLLSLVFSRVKQAPMPFLVKPVARGIADKVLSDFVDPQIRLHMDYMEDELGRCKWFAGSRFSAADIQMSFPVEAGVARGEGAWPRLEDFLQRIHARPAYKRALKRGGPFTVGR